MLFIVPACFVIEYVLLMFSVPLQFAQTRFMLFRQAHANQQSTLVDVPCSKLVCSSVHVKFACTFMNNNFTANAFCAFFRQMTRDSAPADIWAIPPPFESGNFGRESQLGGGTRTPGTFSLKRSGSYPRTPDLKVSYSGHSSVLASTPAWRSDSGASNASLSRRKAPGSDLFPRKPGPWIPATKHRHAITGCAPNGLRLFGPAPSMLLSGDKKKQRDLALRQQLNRLQSDILDFETANMSANGFDHGPSKSMAALGAAHGRMNSDLREMQQVVEQRCASRWAPGLGRRRPGQNQMNRRALASSRAILTPLSEQVAPPSGSWDLPSDF